MKIVPLDKTKNVPSDKTKNVPSDKTKNVPSDKNVMHAFHRKEFFRNMKYGEDEVFLFFSVRECKESV